MSNIGYVLASVAWISLVSLTVATAPGLVQELTQGSINTSTLQNEYDTGNLSAQANATNTNNVVDQATGLVNVLANPAGDNQYLALINLVILAGLIAWLIAEVWIG